MRLTLGINYVYLAIKEKEGQLSRQMLKKADLFGCQRIVILSFEVETIDPKEKQLL